MLKRLIIVLALAVHPVGIAAQDARQITVSGVGAVEAEPDMATITLGVTSEARGAREAIDENSKAMAGVLERLLAAGIEGRDLQTTLFSVSPRFDYRNSTSETKPSGFVAQNFLTIRVRDLTRLGEVLDEVGRDGANAFNGLAFGLQNPQPIEDAAREAAVADARRKAELFAAASGVALGRVLLINEGGGASRPQVFAAEAASRSSNAVPIASGELTVTARITVIYEISEP